VSLTGDVGRGKDTAADQAIFILICLAVVVSQRSESEDYR